MKKAAKSTKKKAAVKDLSAKKDVKGGDRGKIFTDEYGNTGTSKYPVR